MLARIGTLAVSDASAQTLMDEAVKHTADALDAMLGGGTLTIAIRPHETRRNAGVLLTFTDTGKGIPPEDLQRIFEPFFTSGKAKGVGLGLTIAHDIIERHRGQITIASPPGHGATVEVWLPLKSEA